jgi:hypothetical protein
MLTLLKKKIFNKAQIFKKLKFFARNLIELFEN